MCFLDFIVNNFVYLHNSGKHSVRNTLEKNRWKCCPMKPPAHLHGVIRGSPIATGQGTTSWRGAGSGHLACCKYCTRTEDGRLTPCAPGQRSWRRKTLGRCATILCGATATHLSYGKLNILNWVPRFEFSRCWPMGCRMAHDIISCFFCAYWIRLKDKIILNIYIYIWFYMILYDACYGVGMCLVCTCLWRVHSVEPAVQGLDQTRLSMAKDQAVQNRTAGCGGGQIHPLFEDVWKNVMKYLPQARLPHQHWAGSQMLSAYISVILSLSTLSLACMELARVSSAGDARRSWVYSREEC